MRHPLEQGRFPNQPVCKCVAWFLTQVKMMRVNLAESDGDCQPRFGAAPNRLGLCHHHINVRRAPCASSSSFVKLDRRPSRGKKSKV